MLTLPLLLTALAADPPPSPTIPVAADAVVAAQRLHLATPWTYTWSAEPRAVSDVVLLTVRVDPDLARPRQTWNPVLYAGDAPVEVIARTDDATCLVGLVPADDVARRTLFWGPQRLPEDVTAAHGAAAEADARAAGARPLGEAAARLAGAQRAAPSLSRSGAEVTALLAACAR